MATTKRKSSAKKNAKVVLVPATAAEIIASLHMSRKEIERVDTILQAVLRQPKTRRAAK